MSREAFEKFANELGLRVSFQPATRRYDDSATRSAEAAWQYQQARIDAIEAELSAMKAQEPVATVKLVAISRDIVTNEPLQFEAVLVDSVEMGETLEDGQKLYAAPQAPAAPVSQMKLGSTDNPRNFYNPVERIAYQLGWNDCVNAQPASPVSDHIRDAAQMVSERELPPLPDPDVTTLGSFSRKPMAYFTADQMQDYARAALNQPANHIPEGMVLVPKPEFDDLMYWLDRCDEKGHLDNCPDLIEPLADFNKALLAAAQEGK